VRASADAVKTPNSTVRVAALYAKQNQKPKGGDRRRGQAWAEPGGEIGIVLAALRAVRP